MGRKNSADRGNTLQGLLHTLFCLAFLVGLCSPDLHAQGAGAAIQGTVSDSTGAVIAGATITATNIETNLQRTVTSNSTGLYVVPNLPPGKYRVQVSMAGFQSNIRENLDLVVGGQLVLNTSLQLGEITQQVTVVGEAPLVNTSVAQVSGLVGERQVKDLPLNGRSFDNLVTLNPGTVNSTAIKSGATSSSGPGNYFAISGRRPGENIFLLNGVEYPGGSAAASSTPGGVSGQLLGIDAVREFNVVLSIDSAEVGHRAGGQISVVTASGTNLFHGSLFEFLRNSALDARNFFDHGTVPPFKRNQFGGSGGGPIQKDKTFVFGSYEGFRQRLGFSIVAFVPDEEARSGRMPDSRGVYQPVPGFSPAVVPYLQFWPQPNGPELLANGLPTGTALSFANPAGSTREEFGTTRVDRTFSERDTFSGTYTIDDGESVNPGANPLSFNDVIARSQVLTLAEIHVFSPSLVNSFTAGFSRAHYGVSPLIGTQPPGTGSLVTGLPFGQIKIGGGGATGGTGSLSLAGPGANINSNQAEATNIFTYEDQIHLTRGIHSLVVGLWFERLQNNELNLSYGQAVFPDLVTFLKGLPSTMTVQLHAALVPWRSWLGAWYVQDAIRLRPNFILSLGLRHEFSNGVNNPHGEAANLVFGPGGALLTDPVVGGSLLTTNNQRWLFGPRAGLAWDPFGKGHTSIRAGFGIAHNLLDGIGFCCRTNLPFFSNFDITNASFPFEQSPNAPFPAGIIVKKSSSGGGGIQPDAEAATVVNYRFEIEQALGTSTSLRVAYIGSHGYHDLQRADSNTAVPLICSRAQNNCPAGLPDGTKYFPAGAPRRNPNLSSIVQFYSSAINSYNSAAVDLNRRFKNGLAFRGNYTYAKSLDNASSLSSAQAIGNPALALDPFGRMRDYGLSAFDVRQRFSFSGSYELPAGAGKKFFSGASGVVEKAVSGWQANVITNLQSGFPLTPLLGFNQSRDGNTSTPDRASFAPGRTLSGIYLGKPDRWFDPSAFALPLIGTYGNAGRNILEGPHFASVDVSLFKTTYLSERFHLQFRAEVFNLLNHASFRIPSPTVLQPSGTPAGSAGVVTGTATTSRQIQFGLKLNF